MEKFNYEGKDYKVFEINTKYSYNKVILVPTKYTNNDTLGIMILGIHGRDLEPFAVMTVNLCTPFQSEKTAYVDTNNNGYWGVRRFIASHRLGKKTGINTISGNCIYPLYEFDVNKFYAK